MDLFSTLLQGSAVTFFSTISLSLPSCLTFKTTLSSSVTLTTLLLHPPTKLPLFIIHFWSFPCFFVLPSPLPSSTLFFHTTPLGVLLIHFFCLIVHIFFHGRPMPRVSQPATAEAVTNCHWLPIGKRASVPPS